MRARAWLMAAVMVFGACASEADRDGATPSTSVVTTTTTAGATTAPHGPTTTISERAGDRERMVTEQIAARGVSAPDVLDAMRSVPRHAFVPDSYRPQAYDDHPLPIGHGQTISQPYIVALMSEMLEVEPGDRVLEVGTGSGYQAAVLAAMGLDVYTVEIVPELAARAARVLSDLGYDAIVRAGDGYFGWEEHAPFDAIIVTAAPDHVPQPLLGQLAPGGHMVIPVGPIGAVQTLWRFTVDAEGETIAENLGAVRFVPLTRDEG